MTSYTLEIRQCPRCNSELVISSVASCNGIDARMYTDGFVIGPMYDEGSALLSCPNCKEYFWLENANHIKNIDYVLCEGYKWAETVRDIQFFDVIERCFWTNKSQEKHVRIRAWWSYNSAFRDVGGEFFSISNGQLVNLKRLLELLDENNRDESIIKAEIYRELGLFKESIELLNVINEEFRISKKNQSTKQKRISEFLDGNNSRMLEVIQELAEAKIKHVSLVT